MRTVLISMILLIVLLLILVDPAFAGQHLNARIVSHADPIHAKCLPCACTDQFGPYVCDEENPLDVTGDLLYSYTHMFLELVDLDPALGVREVSFGFDYDGAPNSGIDDVVWYQCYGTAYPSAPPDPAWPEAGSWVRIVYDECMATTPNPADPDGESSVVLGGLALFAWTDDALAIVPAPDPDHPGEFRIRVVDCSGEVTELGPESVVQLGFGAGAGYNPCDGTIAVEPTTWSLLKQLYKD